MVRRLKGKPEERHGSILKCIFPHYPSLFLAINQMLMKMHEPLLCTRPVSHGSLRYYMPLLLYRMQRKDFRILTHQQEQQQQRKPHLAASIGAIPLRKLNSTNSDFILSLHPNLFHLPTPHHLPFLSRHLLYNTIKDKEDKQSRAKRYFSRNDRDRMWVIYVG